MDDLPSLYEGLTHLLSSLFFQIIEAEVSFKMASMLSYGLLVVTDVVSGYFALQIAVQQLHASRDSSCHCQFSIDSRNGKVESGK